ncbi:hypothetical protein OHA98_18820 [Streptomyces sp. NBC_00654]|uniref:hypothetical protein n=1 Tax=Streptomyces sp. NBC_00654 TaxID=2975799 RepID=UPI0022584D44|nr:hypothetical protein [Streptomyces sp. NBC_00654]MCX4966852.1 hypothetical protein [Streptomyces sp. NBC_00654]
MRSIIGKRVLTATAVSGILSLTGGFAVAAKFEGNSGGTPDPPGGHHQEIDGLPEDLCGKLNLGGIAAQAVGDLCAPPHEASDESGSGGDDDGHPAISHRCPRCAARNSGRAGGAESGDSGVWGAGGADADAAGVRRAGGADADAVPSRSASTPRHRK